MWLSDDISIYKRNLVLEKPFLNSAGTLGFAPDPHSMSFLLKLGAFVTNPISLKPRVPASNRTCLPFPGGFLLHTGHPNPGINRVIARYKNRWASAPLPVIVHLLVETPESLVDMIRKLEGLENIMAVELGLPPICTPQLLLQLMDASFGELPVILCLGPEQFPLLKETLSEISPSALRLTEPRGTLPDPKGELVSGRLYGPGIFPLMLNAAGQLKDSGHPLIVNGGIVNRSQAKVLLDMGVTAVGLGSLLWGINPETFF
jgi:dihydroorotate dehydrogenase (NAD+) catalytic subunit